jgi:glycosyltransferase involved in cell wall biosynthesis
MKTPRGSGNSSKAGACGRVSWGRNEIVRVLIVSHGHPAFSIGGAEVASHNLFRALGGTDGIEAFYLARSPAALPRHADTPLMSLRQGERETFLHTEAWDQFWLSNGGIGDLQGAFSDYLRHVRPDVVHFHHVIGLGVEAIVQVRRVLPDAAIVITFHEYLSICINHGQMVKTSRNTLCRGASPAECAGCFPQHSPGLIFQREAFLREHLLTADAFVSPSHFLIDRYAAWGLPRDRFTMIENGLAPHAVAPPRKVNAKGRRSRFGFFGQLSEFKGLHVLLEAVSSIDDDVWGNDAALYIFGGNLENQPLAFRERFDRLVELTARRARLMGSYRSEELPRLMEQVDWVIVPSIWWENSPVVIQEAFLHGRPPIVGDIGGMAEKVRHGIDGLHFRTGSPEDLADRMSEVLTDGGLWKRLHDNVPKPLDLAGFAERHLAVYRDILACRQKPVKRAVRLTRRKAA